VSGAACLLQASAPPSTIPLVSNFSAAVPGRAFPDASVRQGCVNQLRCIDESPLASAEAERLRGLLALHAIALGSLTHGLCLFDADYRIVLFNRRYRELYRLSSDCMRVGVSLDEILLALAK
jgi:PAS domain-containing protein